MARINLDHWFIKENSLSISLMRYYVIICPIAYNSTLSYVLNVMDDENNKTFYFDNLDDAVYFTEEIINKSNSIQEMINEYNTYLENPKTYRKK